MPVLTEAERHALAMRLVGDFEARRFHVELATAELVGGGTIAGRVHRDRELAAGPIVVRARCMEAWREAPPRVPIVPANRVDAHAALARAHAVVGGARARRALRGALGRLRVHAAARPAAGRRGALGRLALRDPGAAARCGCGPTSARSRCRSATARCCSSPGCRSRCASREARRPPGRRGRLRPGGPGLRARPGELPRGRRRGDPGGDRRRAGAHAARARRGHRQAHARADRQRRARDRARARGRDARRAGADGAGGRAARRASPRRSRSPTRASTPWSPRRPTTGSTRGRDGGGRARPAPGGAVALVWNRRDERVAWMREFTRILDAHAGDAPRYTHGPLAPRLRRQPGVRAARAAHVAAPRRRGARRRARARRLDELRRRARRGAARRAARADRASCSTRIPTRAGATTSRCPT